MGGNEVSEQLGAVDDGNVFRPRHGEIRYLDLHRRRKHESGAVLGDAAPVLGHDFDAKTFELHAKRCALATVERTLAAARMSTDHHVELFLLAHSRPTEPCVVESAL